MKLIENLNNELKGSKLKIIILSALILINIAFVSIICYAIYKFDHLHTENMTEQNDEYTVKVYRHNIELQYYKSKKTLIDSIHTYIRKIAPNSCMNGSAFVDISEQYNIDVFFILSQCQCESLFNTTGLSLKTNSAFGVKAYDGKGHKHMDRYRHPDLSIEPYVRLLKQDYIYDDKTEYDLLQKYVNKEGKRYASDPSYEKKLFKIYNILDTRFGNTYKEYLKMYTLANR